MRWFEWRAKRDGWRQLAGVTMGMLLLALSGHAWAQASCTGNAESFTLQMPAKITVPRDAPVGTLLSGWVSSSANQNWYNCTITNTTTIVTLARTVSLTKSDLTITNGGVTYAVLNTNLPGVGIAIGFSAYINGMLFPVFDLGTPVLGFCQYDGYGNAYSNTTFTTGGQISVMLVKTGSITAGTISVGVIANGAVTTSNSHPFVAQPSLKSFSLTPTIVTVLACTTPNVTVSMGSYKASVFTGKGSSTSPVSFNVALDSCPAGMKTIQYEFDAPGGVVDPANGVIALSSDSTAKGVGLKLMDSTGATLNFDKQYQLSAYNAATGGSYTVPLKAAYCQTATSVTPGTANAVMTFMMTYQ